MKRSLVLEAAEARRRHILAALEDGVRQVELARVLGVSQQRISEIVRRSKLPPRKRPRRVQG